MKLKKNSLLILILILMLTAYAGGNSDLYRIKGHDNAKLSNVYVGLGVGGHKYRYDIITNIISSILYVSPLTRVNINNGAFSLGGRLFIGDYLYCANNAVLAVEIGALLSYTKNISGSFKTIRNVWYNDVRSSNNEFTLKIYPEKYLALRPILYKDDWNIHLMAGIIGTYVEMDNKFIAPNTAFRIGQRNYDGDSLTGVIIGLGASFRVNNYFSIRVDYNYSQYFDAEFTFLNGLVYSQLAGPGDKFAFDLNSKGNHYLNLSMVSELNNLIGFINK